MSLLVFADPIIGIDVTADGRWLCATTEKYLLVVRTDKVDDAKGRTGFDVSTCLLFTPRPPTPLRVFVCGSSDSCKCQMIRIEIDISRAERGWSFIHSID